MYLTMWLLVAAAIFCVFSIVRFLIKFNRRKKRISKYVEHLASPKDEYPLIGSALRFFGKSTEGGICCEMFLEEIEEISMDCEILSVILGEKIKKIGKKIDEIGKKRQKSGENRSKCEN